MQTGLAGWEFVTDPAVPIAQVCVPGSDGVVKSIKVKVGDKVEAGDGLLVIEAMKMENEIRATRAGWLPFYPQFDKSSIDVVTEAEAAGAKTEKEIVDYVVAQLKEKKLRFAVEDPGLGMVAGSCRSFQRISEEMMWNEVAVALKRSDGSENARIFAIGLPPTTDFVTPRLVAGRWLLPGDTNAIVVNSDVAKDEPQLRVGHKAKFSVRGKDEEFEIVGLV